MNLPPTNKDLWHALSEAQRDIYNRFMFLQDPLIAEKKYELSLEKAISIIKNIPREVEKEIEKHKTLMPQHKKDKIWRERWIIANQQKRLNGKAALQ